MGWLAAGGGEGVSGAGGSVEWIGEEGDKSGEVWVWWKGKEEWARAVEEWVDRTGNKNAVLTFYELLHGDATGKEGTCWVEVPG